MRFKILITGFLLVIFCASPSFALENDIGFSKLDPGSPLYFLKVIKENIEAKLALTPHVQMIRDLEFATRRLREAKSLELTNPELIPSTLEKYVLHLKKLPQTGINDKEVLTRIRQSLGVHILVLQQQLYEQTENQRAKMAIRSTLNKIIERDDISSADKMPVCDFFLKESTSSALNQTEQLVLQVRSNKCKVVLP